MLLGGKVFLPVIAIVIAFSFVTGALHWDSDKARCLVPRRWNAGQWHTGWAIGKLEFRYKAKDYGCDPEYKLDPTQWKGDGFGTVTPKLTD